MSTFTKLSKQALSSRWFLHPVSQEPAIQQSHIYLHIHWLVNQEYIGEITFQLSFVHTCYFPVTWAYPNVNQQFSSKSQSECLSVLFCVIYITTTIPEEVKKRDAFNR